MDLKSVMLTSTGASGCRPVCHRSHRNAPRSGNVAVASATPSAAAASTAPRDTQPERALQPYASYEEQHTQQPHGRPQRRRPTARWNTHISLPADNSLEQLASANLSGSAWSPSPTSAHTQSSASGGQGSGEDPAGWEVCNLAKANRFREALAALRKLVAAKDHEALERVFPRYFMRLAANHKESEAALAFLNIMPAQYHHISDYQTALAVCARARDSATASKVVELCTANGFQPDTKMYTALMNVYKTQGASERVFAIYADMKRQNLPLDAHVIGVMLATLAEAMLIEGPTGQQDRRTRLVLMERATGLLKEAQDRGLSLTNTCWNSLIVCAGRCGLLKRAFEIWEQLQASGLRSDPHTYGALMESCLLAGRRDMAVKLFDQACAEGHTSSVILYSLGVTAARGARESDWQRVQQITSTMARHKVTPDAVYYSAVISAAGLAGHLPYAFDLLHDMTAEGMRPGPEVCSMLIFACFMHRQHQLARKVYDLCAAKGVYPDVSVFNRMMDTYANERRLGDVVSLLTDMTQRAKLQPNGNTYRILLQACQRTDQAALAFDIFAVMKLNRVIIHNERLAQTVYFTLIKCCLNMLRHIWAMHNPHPAPWASQSRAGLPSVRLGEARQVLRALGTSLEERGSHSLVLQDVSPSTWSQYAFSTYRDMLAREWKPNADILDKLLACLRIPASLTLQQALATGRTNHTYTGRGSPPATAPATGGALGHVVGAADSGPAGGARQPLFGWAPGPLPHTASTLTHQPSLTHTASESGTGTGGTGGSGESSPGLAKYQLVFERRALGVVEDAVTRGLLTSFSLDQPCTLDLTPMPPTLAEVYVASLLTALERRGTRGRADSSPGVDASLIYHRVTIIVPPFDEQYVMWPSYVPKLSSLADGEGGVGMGMGVRGGSEEGEGDSTTSSEDLATSTTDDDDVVIDVSKTLADDRSALSSVDYTDVEQVEAIARVAQGAPVSNNGQAAPVRSASPSEPPMGRPSTSLAVASTLRRFKLPYRAEAHRGVITLEPLQLLKWIKEKRTYDMRLSGVLSERGAPRGISLARQHIQSMGYEPPSHTQPQSQSQGGFNSIPTPTVQYRFTDPSLSQPQHTTPLSHTTQDSQAQQPAQQPTQQPQSQQQPQPAQPAQQPQHHAASSSHTGAHSVQQGGSNSHSTPGPVSHTAGDVSHNTTAAAAAAAAGGSAGAHVNGTVTKQPSHHTGSASVAGSNVAASNGAVAGGVAGGGEHASAVSQPAAVQHTQLQSGLVLNRPLLFTPPAQPQQPDSAQQTAVASTAQQAASSHAKSD